MAGGIGSPQIAKVQQTRNKPAQHIPGRHTVLLKFLELKGSANKIKLLRRVDGDIYDKKVT